VARHQALTEFRALNEPAWPDPGELPPDLRFEPIWPVGPGFTEEGAAIVRFFMSADCPNVTITLRNKQTGQETNDFENVQFSAGGRIESVMRVIFPKDGNYELKIYGGPGPGLSIAKELFYSKTAWNFRVTGTPAPNRSLSRLITGRTFAPLCVMSEDFRIDPAESVVQLPNTLYKFVCSYRGGGLGINAREAGGDPDDVTFADQTVLPANGEWSREDCTIVFPREGIWEVLYFLESNEVAIQKVIAGKAALLEPTTEEKVALAAVPD
jgi:hypothetical protein